MTEVPEHLLKRAKAARDKSAAAAPEPAAEEATEAPAASSGGDSRIPAHLLARSKSAKARKAEGGDEPAAEAGGGTATAVATAPTGGTVVAAGGPVRFKKRTEQR